MKVDKYDRQVRIWGPKGQRKLGQAKVAIVGCCGATIEAAKNLILPGIGTVDILDNKTITVNDLSSSFFYTHESVGKLRGQQAHKNLIQMNPDVQGQFKQVSIQQILSSPQTYLQPYTLIIAGNLPQEKNRQLSQKCWQLNVPVIFITSVGFYFHVRSQKQVHVVESENIAGKKYYLRLHEPFEELAKYVEGKGLAKIVQGLRECQSAEEKQNWEKEFSKITYPVFLVESFKKLRQHFGRNPKPQEVKDLLKQWKGLVREDPDTQSGVNEALTRTFDLYQGHDNFLPNSDIFNDPAIESSTGSSQFIYIFLRSVKQFITRYNHLPQLVRLPDISTTTKDYLQFKDIYKREHESDKLKLKALINEIFGQGVNVNDQLLGEYINNIDALNIVKMRRFKDELENPNTLMASLDYLGDVKSLFVAFRCFKIFEQQHGRAPTPGDLEKMLEFSNKLALQYSLTEIDPRFIKEICRYQGQSLVSYDSMAGAITGQQAVKLITHCFTPLNSGFFFDGLQAKGHTVAL